MLDNPYFVWGAFAALGGIIIMVGPRLSTYGDIIAVKTGMERSWIGIILLALVTSLPEVATSASAASLDLPDVVFGNVYGSNLFNVLILAILDIFYYRKGALLEHASRKSLLISGFGIKMMVLSLLPLVLYNLPGLGFTPVKIFGTIDISSLLLIGLYLIGMRMIFMQENRTESESTASNTIPAEEDIYASITASRAYGIFALLALLIILSGIGMSILADVISTYELPIGDGIPIGQSLVGIILLAVVTSLPELMVSIGAVQIGQIDMAVGNVLGSNIFNMLIIGIADFFYTSGSLLNRPTVTGDAAMLGLSSHLLIGLAGIFMIGVVTVRLSYQPVSGKKICISSWALIAVFLTTYVLLFMINFGR